MHETDSGFSEVQNGHLSQYDFEIKQMVESLPVSHLVTLGCTTDLVYNLFIFHKLNLNASLMYDTQEQPKTEINTKGLDFVVSGWALTCNNESL